MAGFTPTDDLRDLRAVLSPDVDLDANERLVMARLILHRNNGSGRCDPSVSLLAAECGIGRRTVIRAVASLEARGVVERERRMGCRTRYTLHPPTSATQTPVPESHQCQSDTGPVPESHRTSASQAPERTSKRTTERTQVISDLWTAYVEKLDAGRMKLNTHRKKLLRLLYTEQLEGEDDPMRLFGATLDAVRVDDFIMGKRAYHTIDSLFRNESNREKWVNEGRDRLDGKGENPLMLSPDEVRRYGE